MAKKKLSILVSLKDRASKKMQKIGKQFPKLGAAAKALINPMALATAGIAAIGVASVLAARKMAAMIQRQADLGDKFDKMSQQIGVSVEDLSALKLAVDLGGSSIESLSRGLGQLAKNAIDMSRGMGEAKQEFIDLGIEVTDNEGRMKKTIDIMFDVSNVFAQMEDGTAKTAAAMRLFGKAGKELIPVLNQGEDAIRDIMQRSEELGVVWSTEDATAAAAFNDAVTELNTAVSGLEKSLAVELIPTLTEFVDVITDASQIVTTNWDDIMSLLQAYDDLTFGVGRSIRIMKEAIRTMRILGAVAGGFAGGGVSGAGRALGEATVETDPAIQKAKATFQEILESLEQGAAAAAVGGVRGGVQRRAGKGKKGEVALPGEFLGAVGPDVGEDAFDIRLREAFEKEQLALQELQELRNEANLTSAELLQDHWDNILTLDEDNWEARIANNQAKADIMQRSFDALGFGISNTMARAMAGMVLGQKLGSKQMVKAVGGMLGDIAGMWGDFHIGRGIAVIAEGGWPPNPIAVRAGFKEIFAGTALKAMSFVGAGVGGGGRGGGGGGGGATVGGFGGAAAGVLGLPGDVPGRNEAILSDRRLSATIELGPIVSGYIEDIPGLTRRIFEQANKEFFNDIDITFAGDVEGSIH